MPPNHFESEVESFLEGSHGDRTHIKRADHHTVTPLCGTLLEKIRPTPPLRRLFREKVRPARPLRRLFREKVRPARKKTPNLCHFERAGRTFSRFHDLTATQGELFRARRRRPSRALPISDPAQLVSRAPEGPEGLAAVPAGDGGVLP